MAYTTGLYTFEKAGDICVHFSVEEEDNDVGWVKKKQQEMVSFFGRPNEKKDSGGEATSKELVSHSVAHTRRTVSHPGRPVSKRSLAAKVGERQCSSAKDKEHTSSARAAGKDDTCSPALLNCLCCGVLLRFPASIRKFRACSQVTVAIEGSAVDSGLDSSVHVSCSLDGLQESGKEVSR